ncbi:Uma2 family endonuclease [Micromonospora sp. CNB394]|uniref:Uma2 family endonuclease n=1 Tax=Micromonospora sp. CNB394 TaxID=1169151 RepID=UPI001E33B632|nr:Uma2 family endonuclease [Micromonospora sp. CNB394]
MRVGRHNEPRPDVVIRRKHAGRSPVPVEDALLAGEVVPAGWHFSDRYDKTKVYARSGIRSYWLVDPQRERVTLTEYTLDGAAREYQELAHTEGVRHRAALEGLGRSAGADRAPQRPARRRGGLIG